MIRLLITCIICSLSVVQHFAGEGETRLHYDSVLNVVENTEYLEGFYEKLDSLANIISKNSAVFFKSQQKVSIVHIGDSHIQADYLSGETRRRFQNDFGNGGRGFVFPYQIARSNGPSDFVVSFEGNWQSHSVLKNYENSRIGVSGFVVSSADSASLSFNFSQSINHYYGFNKITIFERNGVYYPDPESAFVLMSGVRSEKGMNYSRFILKGTYDSLTLLSNTRNAAELHGLVFENKFPGILYHSMGTNGASTLQYLRSTDFEAQIAALQANLVILSFGTNDCYLPGSRFCKECIKDRYRTIIKRIRTENPDVSILITTPPDSYYRRRYDNRNIKYFSQAMKELSEELKVGVWDLYSAMGGARSIMNWYHAGLARGDLIHFTKEGYRLQGSMLYEAIKRGYEKRFD